MISDRARIVYGLMVLAALVVSGLHPYDRTTWWMEIAPILLVAPAIIATHRRFPLSDLLFILICTHALMLMVGGAYTYARVPLGFWLQDVFDLSRNPYDKIGHFMQGFVPALAAREIVLRNALVSGTRMAAFVAVCTALAISAIYELVEWAAALALGQGADEFLGTQGDVWDTQSDMFLALIGAGVAMVFFSALHDRRMRMLPAREPN